MATRWRWHYRYSPFSFPCAAARFPHPIYCQLYTAQLQLCCCLRAACCHPAAALVTKYKISRSLFINVQKNSESLNNTFKSKITIKMKKELDRMNKQPIKRQMKLSQLQVRQVYKGKMKWTQLFTNRRKRIK